MYYFGIAVIIVVFVGVGLLSLWTLTKIGFGPDYDACADDLEPDDGTSRGLYWWLKKKDDTPA